MTDIAPLPKWPSKFPKAYNWLDMVGEAIIQEYQESYNRIKKSPKVPERIKRLEAQKLADLKADFARLEDSRNEYRRMLYNSIKTMIAMDVNPEFIADALTDDRYSSALLANKTDCPGMLDPDHRRRQKMFLNAYNTVCGCVTLFTEDDRSKIGAAVDKAIDQAQTVFSTIDQRHREVMRNLFKQHPLIKKLFAI